MISRGTCRNPAIAWLLIFAPWAVPREAPRLVLPPDTPALLDKIYSFDLPGTAEAVRRMEEEHPEHPLGYLLEAEAAWWKIWCESAEFKYGMTDARHRAKLDADRRYLQVVAKALSLAEAQIKQRETAEMHFYAGMADASSARLLALRGESRAAARVGVRAREQLLRAKSLDPDLADADMGLGLYDYYVDTLGGIARIFRLFMGIPGGSKQEGIRLLEHAITSGDLTPSVARFYLALNLHRYDQQYEKALELMGPLTEKYPTNPLFQLARGDLFAKLGRKEQALACYRAAAAVLVEDEECQKRIQELARKSIAALGMQ